VTVTIQATDDDHLFFKSEDHKSGPHEINQLRLDESLLKAVAKEIRENEQDVISAYLLEESRRIRRAIDTAIRHTISFFVLQPFHAHMNPLEVGSEVLTPNVAWRIFAGKVEPDQPPLLIYDNLGLVTQNSLDYSLEPLDENELTHVLAELNRDDEAKGKKIEQIWLKWPESEHFMFKPVPRLRDPNILRTIDWSRFVNEYVTQFVREGCKPEKDASLALVHKGTSLDGIEVGINPNSVQITNGGTTKTTFYTNMGVDYTKVTPGAFLGYARSPDEVYLGIINGVKCPVALDQIESQGVSDIMRFLFNTMEQGFDFVGSGAVKFRVSCDAIFNVLGNAKETKDPTKSFRYILLHLSFNPAMGRRFGVIIYGSDFRRVTTKPSPREMVQWKKCILLYKAVEEYARDKIRRLVESSPVRAWLNEPIIGYEEQIQFHIDAIDDDNVQGFLLEHAAGAQCRVRGFALYAAIVDLMDKIALDEIGPEELVEHADDILPSIQTINIQSIAKIAANWKGSADYARLLFKNFPDYMKVILSAAELWHRQYPESSEILLRQIPYELSDGAYTHLSKCVGKLAKRTAKRKAQALEEVRTYFDMELIEKPEGLLVHYLKPGSCDAIEPIGKLSPISPLSPFHQSLETPQENGLGSESVLSTIGETGKTVKTVKEEPAASRIPIDREEILKKLRELKSAPTIQHYIDRAESILHDRDRAKDLVQALRKNCDLIESPDGGWAWRD
jgi:hypothetical protein